MSDQSIFDEARGDADNIEGYFQSLMVAVEEGRVGGAAIGAAGIVQCLVSLRETINTMEALLGRYYKEKIEHAARVDRIIEETAVAWKQQLDAEALTARAHNATSIGD